MNFEICKKCSCDDCVLFFKYKENGNEENGNEEYVHVRKDIDPKERKNADITIAKMKDGRFLCTRCDNGGWRDRFEWKFDNFIPFEERECECYAEQLLEALNNHEY